MLRILRITVMWLLALAVPVQGFAAASMVGCGAGHHAGVEHAMAQSHHHHKHGDGDLGGEAKKPGSDGSAEAKVSKASCSACASCCTAAALPTTPVVFQSADAPSVFVAFAPQAVVSFVSGGLERPPRPFLA